MKIIRFSLAILHLIPIIIFGQTPGGVNSDLKLWVNGNLGVSTTGTLVDTWTYINDGSKSFSGSGVTRPVLNSNSINFSPALQFGSGSKYLDGPVGSLAPLAAGDDDYSVFVVWKSNITTSFQRIWAQRSTSGFANDALAISTWDASPPGPGVYGPEFAINPFSHTIQRSYVAGNWNISQINLLAQATGDLEVIDDRNIMSGIATFNTDPAGIDGAALRNLSDATHRIGASFDASGPLVGDIAEIIVYDRPISGAERNRVFSYLAVKYGMHLGTNLIASNNAVIWNATANSTYNNAVFGLGRDNATGGSDLLVNQSNSFVTGSGNGTGQSGMGNIVLSNPSQLDNLEFLQIGHDNGALTESASADVGSLGAGALKLGREWKVQHTGNVGTVTLAMDFSGLTVTGTLAEQFRIMVDEDGDGNFTTGTTRYYEPQSFAGNVAVFNNVVLNNNEVFAFLTQVAGTALPVTWKYFKATRSGNNANLNWIVEHNENGRSYDIEHSINGTNFSKIGEVANKPGTFNYTFTHTGLTSAENFYRIKQFDTDGKSYYSLISRLEKNISTFAASLAANPVRGKNIDLIIGSEKPRKISVEILTMSGARLVTRNLVVNAGVNNYPLDGSGVPAGSYLIQIRTEEGVRTIKFIKP